MGKRNVRVCVLLVLVCDLGRFGRLERDSYIHMYGVEIIIILRWTVRIKG